jgi:immune inhibitor A
MRRTCRALAVSALVAVIVAGGASGATGAARKGGVAFRTVPSMHDRVGPARPTPRFVRKWQEGKTAAADLVARGLARVRADGRVRLPNGQFVDYALEDSDHIVALLVEFTDVVHNLMPEPNRTEDNTTYWIPDFSRAHYEDMMFADGGGSYGFPSMADYYEQVSSGRYTVEGQVSEWLQVPFPAAEFGANGPDGPGSDNANGPVYRIVDEAVKEAAAHPNAGIDWSSNVVDLYDRYDCDGDGVYDEPDGYVDHFTILHAGIDEAAALPGEDEDALWSHSSIANYDPSGAVGPAGCKLGGYRIPGTNVWVLDYTIEPENGGVGVLAHEFGHDLGLPDLYDVTGGAGNSVSFWDLMSAGSWPSDDPETLDTKPVHMGAWDKLALGWLGEDLAQVDLGDRARVTLGPGEGASTSGAQALRVSLPDYRKTESVFHIDGGDPFYYYSGKGDGLDNTMTRSLDAPTGTEVSLTFRTRYDIETDWDYAYVVYSTDSGSTWQRAEGNLSTDDDPNGQNFGNGITGKSTGWVDGEYTLPAGTTDVGFEYWTDVAVARRGLAVDSISLDGGPVDTGEDPSAWSFDGFRRVRDGTVRNTYFHYYLVESRSYVRNDTSLCGAYLFVTWTWVRRACYADGLLVWYRNSRFTDNDVSEHPGKGQLLVVDSHPSPAPWPNGRGVIRESWQTWDATFGLARHAIRLDMPLRDGSIVTRRYVADPISGFHDSGPRAYWSPKNPNIGVRTPASGLRISILGVSDDGTTYRVR